MEQKNETESLLRQIQALGLEGMSRVGAFGLCPNQEMVLYEPESAATLATSTIKEHVDDVFIENLEHAQSDVEEICLSDYAVPKSTVTLRL